MLLPGQDLALGDALLLVTVEMDPDHEDEINRWFDEEHVPERLECPGFLWARRYRVLEGSPTYVNLYGLADPDVLESDAYRAIRPPSDWRNRAVAGHVRNTRSVYRNITKPYPEGYRANATRSGHQQRPA